MMRDAVSVLLSAPLGRNSRYASVDLDAPEASTAAFATTG
jgi:hypothetical protein